MPTAPDDWLPARPNAVRVRDTPTGRRVRERYDSTRRPQAGSPTIIEGDTTANRTQQTSPGDPFRTRFDDYLDSRSARVATAARQASSASNKARRLIDPALPEPPPSQIFDDSQIGTARRSIAASNLSYTGIRRPARSVRSSLSRMSHRLSITPSDIQLPIAQLDYEDRGRTQELLGTRSRRTSFPLPRIPEQTLPDTNTEPQNGKRAWLVALAAVLVVFNCWGFSNAFGVFQAYYEHYYLPGESPGKIAWIGSTQIALVFGLGVPIGQAVDKGYFRVCFHGGSLLMVMGLLLSSYCESWIALWLVQGVITGLGMGSVFTAGLIALMTWFDQTKMGLAMGIAAAGSCLGGIIFIVIARDQLLSNGYGNTVRILSLVMFLSMLPPQAVFRLRKQRVRPRSRSRSQMDAKKRLHDLRTFADAPYIFAAAGLFFSFQGLYFGFVYLVSYALDVLHVGPTAASNLLIFMLIANLPGRFVPALISDKCIGPLNTLIPCTIISSAVLWLWLASGNVQQGGLTVIACFYGFVCAGIQSLYAPATYSFCLRDRYDASGFTPNAAQEAMDKIGLRAGVVYSVIGLGVLIGTPIAGALVTAGQGRENPFLYAQIFAATSLLLGGCCLTTSRCLKVGPGAKRA